MQKSAAYERYETAIQEIQQDERQAQAKADELLAKEQEFILHKVCTITCDYPNCDPVKNCDF